MKTTHLTSVHCREDTRIFVKQCRSLARHHDVTLVVADGRGNAASDGVTIIDAGQPSNRYKRMARAPWRVLSAAPDADLYHLHDPELIPVGLALKSRGKAVIFDAHEDLPQQIMAKHYLPRATRKPLSSVVARAEIAALRHFDAVVAATPHIRDKFTRAGIRAIDICNYPRTDEITPAPWTSKEPLACYIGAICKVRGSEELAATADLMTRGRIAVAGKGPHDIPKSPRLDMLGFQDRRGVQSLLSRSMAGIVALHPTPAYLPSLPVKMFEYMAAGIPVIASDFPLWRKIVTEADCGVLVDPLDSKAIAAAVDSYLAHPAEAERMGRNGRKAVEQRYNWSTEFNKLVSFYTSHVE